MWTQEKVKAKIAELNLQLTSVKSEINHLHEHLEQDEEIIYAVSGTLKHIHRKEVNSIGMAIATSKRLLFYRRSIIGTETKESIRLDNITSVSARKGILMGSLCVYAANNEAIIDQIVNRSANTMAEKINALLSAPKVAAHHSHTAPSVDKISQLEKLFELKTKGALTEEEYQAEKKRLL